MNSTNDWPKQLRCAGRLIAGLFAILLALEADASTPQIPFAPLINAAEEVAIVEIQSGNELIDNEKCGKHYKAKVIEQFKGKPNHILTFGSKDGLRIGAKYFVILSDKDTYIRSYLGAASSLTCKALLPGKMISIDFGAMLIDNPSEFNYATEAVMVPSLSILLPRGTQCTQATSVDDFNDALHAVWIKIPEMERITLDSGNASKSEGNGYLESRKCPSPSAKLMGNFSTAPALWRLIDLLEEQQPLTIRKFEGLLDVSMALARRTQGALEWKGPPVKIRYDLGISASFVRAKDMNESSPIEAARINLIGECIRPSEIEEYYGAISSEDEILLSQEEGSTAYRYHRSWGELDFGFENVAPGCLAFVRLQHQ